MKKTLISLFAAVGIGIVTVGLVADEHEERHETHEREHHGEQDHERRTHGGGSGAPYLADPQYALYKEECGDCHLAYPPSMLPASSWQGMMGSLDDHFGDNAELDAPTVEQVSAFLTRNAAGKGRSGYGERAWRATRDRPAPLRITRTDYFRGQHHEVPAKMVTGNPDVVSFSRCQICHRGADQGDFDEHGVRIPGYGRWDD